jgi:hypothetical protein
LGKFGKSDLSIFIQGCQTGAGVGGFDAIIFPFLVFGLSLAVDMLRFISTRQRKSRDSIPKPRAFAGVYQVIAVSGFGARMKFGFNALAARTETNSW